MKMKQFRSILAVATVATSITASSLPSQAFTWDELWGFLNRGSDNAPSSPSSPPQSNGASNEAPQSGGFGNEAPQQAIPASNPAPQQNNFNPYTTAPQQPSIPAQQPNIQKLAFSCISANGNDYEVINRDSPDSNISVGRRPFRVVRKVNVSSYGTNFEKTCRILRRLSSEKVRVGYAIPDNSTLVSVRVSIYVDGQEKTSGILSVGQARAFTADVAGASSYAIVIKPLDGYGYVYSVGVKQPQ
jgi:hypothetical protein